MTKVSAIAAVNTHGLEAQTPMAASAPTARPLVSKPGPAQHSTATMPTPSSTSQPGRLRGWDGFEGFVIVSPLGQAQQDSRDGSVVKAWQASLMPSAMVRYGAHIPATSA